MLAQQETRCLTHRRDIQRPVIPADAIRGERRPYRAIEQNVAVAACLGRVSSVKPVIDRRRPAHRDRIGQPGINAAHPGRQRPRYRAVEMDDLH